MGNAISPIDGLEAWLDHENVEDALSYYGCLGYLAAIACHPSPPSVSTVVKHVLGEDPFLLREARNVDWESAIAHQLQTCQRQLLAGDQYAPEFDMHSGQTLHDCASEWCLGFADALSEEDYAWPMDEQSAAITEPVFTLLEDESTLESADDKALVESLTDVVVQLYLHWRITDEKD